MSDRLMTEGIMVYSDISKTRGQVEAELTNAMIRFEKDHIGRGPLEARTFFIEDMIIVRLRGVLSPAELKLAETSKGRALVKESRRQLFDISRDLLDEVVEEIVGCKIISMHKDISTRTGERVVVFTVDRDVEKLYGAR